MIPKYISCEISVAETEKKEFIARADIFVDNKQVSSSVSERTFKTKEDAEIDGLALWSSIKKELNIKEESLTQ